MKLISGRYAFACWMFVAAWTFLSWPWLSGEVTIPYDAKAHFQAQVQFLANALHTGQSPFWAPNVFGGSPQIADPQSLIFSPAIILAYFEAVPSFRQLDAFALGLLGLAGLSIVLFFRDRGWHPAGAIVAAIAFSFGASAAWRLQHIGQVQSFALFGIALWLLGRTLARAHSGRASLGYGVAAGLLAGLMIVEPDQVALLGCYVLAGYVLHHWLSSPDRGHAFHSSIKPLSGGALAGILLAAAPLLLTYLFVTTSSRPEIAFEEAAHGSLHPASLITALVGDLYGALDPKVDYWGPGSNGWNKDQLMFTENMGQVYLGALPILALLTIGLTRGLLWARDIRYFTIATVVLVLYALGWYTPAFHLMYDVLPGVSLFRRPADATFIFGGTTAIIAGYLVHRWASGTVPAPSPRHRMIETGLLLTGFLIAATIAIKAGHVHVSIKPMLVALMCSAMAVACLLASRQLSSRHRHAATLMIGMLMAWDLSINNGPNQSTGLPPSNYDILLPNCRNPTIRFLKARLTQEPKSSARRDRVELVGLGFEWPNASLVHGFDHVLGYNPLRLLDVTEGVGAQDNVAEPSQRHFTPLFPSYRSTLANLLGLRYIATRDPVEQIDHGLKPGDLKLLERTKDGYIYENPRALPRVLFAANSKTTDFDLLIRTGIWPEFDPRQTVLLDGDPVEMPAAMQEDARPILISSAASTPAPATYKLAAKRPAPALVSNVRLRTYENTNVVIEVETDRAGWVVLNDVWHPWWAAEVDGQAVPIQKANVLFRAVEVPAGKHVVQFEFRPFAGAITELGDRLMGAEN